MTPDVSDVYRAAGEYALASAAFAAGADTGRHVQQTRDALQQAAEQACYRYALELCERLQAKEQDGVSLADGYRAMAREVSFEMQWLKKQLIAGSV